MNGRVVLRVLYYCVVATLLLVAANTFAQSLQVDPLTMAQSERVQFTGPRSPTDPVYTVMPLNEPSRVTIYYVGNSQSYAIMDYVPGDANMITHLSDLLNGGWEQPSSPFPVRIGSVANLTMAELLIRSVVTAADQTHRPDVVVVGVVLDGLRWVEPRKELADFAVTPEVRPLLASLVQTSSDLAMAANVVEGMIGAGSSSPSTAASAMQPTTVAGRPVDAAEMWLQARLDAWLPLFRERTHLYEQLSHRYMLARNILLGLRSTTPRPISDGMYETNLQLIEMTLRFLSSQGIHAVVYFAPIRPVESSPYQATDIARFREDLPQLCTRAKAIYLDYSNLIPEEMWTNYPEAPILGKQPDFAHFTARGHRRLAEQLVADIRPLLHQWLSEKSGHNQAARGQP